MRTKTIAVRLSPRAYRVLRRSAESALVPLATMVRQACYARAGIGLRTQVQGRPTTRKSSKHGPAVIVLTVREDELKALQRCARTQRVPLSTWIKRCALQDAFAASALLDDETRDELVAELVDGRV